ncbi:hypothetical protein JHK85_021712 [Glycine max]|nr:hypothetical protein JHK85_021712 [Glycine max]KAG5025357.1 hypothetical protein JHK86_021271 [Glycine max]
MLKLLSDVVALCPDLALSPPFFPPSLRLATSLTSLHLNDVCFTSLCFGVGAKFKVRHNLHMRALALKGVDFCERSGESRDVMFLLAKPSSLIPRGPTVSFGDGVKYVVKILTSEELVRMLHGQGVRETDGKSSSNRKPSDSMRLIVTTFVGIVFGFFIGVSFPALTTKLNLPSSLLPAIDISYIQEKYAGGNAPSFVKNNNSISSKHRLINDTFKIWVPSNPRGAERLPPEIIEAETDFYLRRLWGQPSELNYLEQFSENFTIVLFHYDGHTTEWDEFEWSKRAIHVSVRKQTKWWYAKRFLHPDIVAPYDYIFIWDEDLGVEHFNAEEYLKLVKKHGLEISQPGLEPNKGLTWQMTKRRGDREVHKETEEKPGWCADPHLPPCAAFVEIMAPVFSRDAWRCVWHMIQPAHEKIGVVDSQWIIHQSVPSLGNQVRERCKREWTMFQSRLANAEDAYYRAVGGDMFNSTTP